MTPEEYADSFMADLEAQDAGTDRTQQSRAGLIGISDLGVCQEQTRRKLAQEDPGDGYSHPAWVGHAMHDRIEQARARNPRLRFQLEVVVELPNGAKVPGHLDELDPDEPSITDWKTSDQMALVRKGYAADQKRWQRHNYGAAAIQAGLVPEKGLIVRNVTLDRGRDPRPHVEQEPFSWDVVKESSEWLTEVYQALRDGHEARKDPPRAFCERYCGFYSTCREAEVDIEPAPESMVSLIDLYGEAHEAETAATALKDAIKLETQSEFAVTTDQFIHRSTWINTGKGHWRHESLRRSS